MQMILGKIFFFPVFVCIIGKYSGKYSTLCVWSNVKQNKKQPTPKTTASHRNPPRNPPPSTTNQPRERAEKEEADRCQDILASLVGSGSGVALVCTCHSSVDLEALSVSAALGFHEADQTERAEKDEADQTYREREQKEQRKIAESRK
jgi:hypothetical protein